jgi:alkylation response protein AidB-like acyl-CoA dehydrogenase
MTHHITHSNATRSRDIFEQPLEALGKRIQMRKAYYAPQRSLDVESWKELAELGLWLVPIPKEFGGFNGSWQDFGYLMYKLAIHGDDLGFSLSAVAHAGLIRVLLRWGSEEQKREYLPRLCSGAIGATAVTEKHGGSDVQSIVTQALPAGPDCFRITGQKAHITNGPCTDIFLAVCKTPGAAGKETSLFILEADTPGVEQGEPERMMGNHTSPTGEIGFHGVMVRNTQLIGGIGEGLGIIFRTIALDRALYGVVTAGLLENVLAQSFDYSLSRHAFGGPIINNQYVQKRLTDIKIAIETSLALAFAALVKIDRDDPEAVLAASLTKLVSSELLVSSAEHFMVIHGHSGYEQGKPTALMSDALATLFAGGTNDIQRVNIFNQMTRMRRQS